MTRFYCKDCGIDEETNAEFHCVHCGCSVCDPDRDRGAA